MTAASPRPKRRHRRMLFATVMLAIGAVALWLLVWATVQRNRRDAWVAGAERNGVDVIVAVDEADGSYTGVVRQWLGIPRVQVYLSKESEADHLVRATTGEPYAMLIHVERPVSAGALDQLGTRFPAAEIRQPAGGLGGMGGNGVGFF